MTVYIICVNHIEDIPTELSYQDDYYDNYYDLQIDSLEIVCVCATEDLAKRAVATYECTQNVGPGDTVYYVPYEVIEEPEIDRGLVKDALGAPTKEQIEYLEEKLKLFKKAYKE